MPNAALGELVDRQAARWLRQTRPAAASGKGPCVALSRLPASDAAELGRRVAEKLDYGFFGIEIVDRIARERGVQRRIVEGLDEHVRSSIERFVVDAFRSRPFSEGDYLRHVVRVVTTLGRRGMAVLLGRGAPFILEPQDALRVLVVAPRERRLEAIAREHGLGPAAAERRLDYEDTSRRDFLAQFGVDPDDPARYDLVVNTGTLGLDAATQLVVEATRRHGV
ncbi:MAG: cytidylate kinase-like family protein [Myxococcota bacterium]|nr:cytidylate kinase-like family protein [Myxococcota bacterium]